MAGVQERTAQWFHDTRKQLKQTLELHRRDVNTEKKADLYNCSYCPKVFVQAKFLVNHVLRRHSENLVLLHKQVLNLTNSEVTALTTSELMKYIKMEFSDLKGELEVVKQVVSDFAHANPEKSSLKSVTPDLMKPHIPLKSTDSIPDDCIPLSECPPNNSNQPTVDTLADLEAKVHDLFESYKSDILLNEVKTAIAINKEEVSEELKSSIQPELRSIIRRIDKNDSEWKMHFSTIQKEVTLLAKLVTENTKKLDSPEALRKLEKKFEQQLQIFLNNSSPHEDKKKVSLNQSVTYRNRRKKSIYTCNSPVLNSCRIAITDRNGIPQRDKNIRKRNRKGNEAQVLVERETTRKPLHNEVNSIIDEKLRSLNIDPRIQKLSTEEYEKKMHLIKSEKEILNNTVTGFSEARNKLDSYVEKLAKSKLKTKCSNKQSFSDSLVLQSTGIEEKHMEACSVKQTSTPCPFEKDALSPVEFAEDSYSQGDCQAVINKMLDTENILVVPGAEKHVLKFEMEHTGVGPSCVNSKKTSDGAYSLEKHVDKPENVKSVSFSGVESHIACSSQNFEELSDLSSLSDLED